MKNEKSQRQYSLSWAVTGIEKTNTYLGFNKRDWGTADYIAVYEDCGDVFYFAVDDDGSLEGKPDLTGLIEYIIDVDCGFEGCTELEREEARSMIAAKLTCFKNEDYGFKDREFKHYTNHRDHEKYGESSVQAALDFLTTEIELAAGSITYRHNCINAKLALECLSRSWTSVEV